MNFEALIPKRTQQENQQPVVRLNVKDPSELGRWIGQEIQNGIPLDQMALLVRKVRGNEKWLKALTSAGISIAVGSGGLFWEEPRVRELVAFLRWWDNPAHSLSGAIFLRAPWMGISDADLDQWIKEDPTWRAPFLRSNHPIAHALKAFEKRIIRPGELLMALWGDPTLEDELGVPLLGLWHRVEELSSKGLDFHAVVGELSLAIEEKRRERDVPAPKALGALRVLTLHGAKGLEFPHVILIDFGEKRRSGDMPTLFWDREKGAYLCARDENGDRDRKHPLEKSWRETEQKRNLEESKRLFYVALTRARDRLVLVCPELRAKESKDSKESKASEEALVVKPADQALTQDHWRGWIEPFSAGLAELKLPNLSMQTSEKSAPQQVQQQQAKSNIFSAELYSKSNLFHSELFPQPPLFSRPRHSVTEWNLLSRCPRAYEWTFIRPLPLVAGLPEIGLHTGEEIPTPLQDQVTRQELGARVHACLENGDYDALKQIENEVGPALFNAEPIASWALNSEWMAPSCPEKNRQVWTELNFEVPVGNEVLVGSIDRLVKVETQDLFQYSLIDFKVTEKPKSTRTLLEAYRTQLELYSYAIKQLDCDTRSTQKVSHISAVIVNISANTVQAVPVALGRSESKRLAPELANEAIQIVNGKPGKAKPGPLCGICEFKPHCPEGRFHLEAPKLIAIDPPDRLCL